MAFYFKPNELDRFSQRCKLADARRFRHSAFERCCAGLGWFAAEFYSTVETLGQKPAHTLHQITDYNIVMVKSLDGFQQGSNVKL